MCAGSSISRRSKQQCFFAQSTKRVESVSQASCIRARSIVQEQYSCDKEKPGRNIFQELV